MNINKFFLFLISITFLYSCADYKANKTASKKQQEYYSSKGFVLIYDDKFYEQKVINKRLDNESLNVMHNFLKRNTLIRIINPSNSKIVETKIYKKSDHPSIFNAVVSKKIASILELDIDNPYVEIVEVKKNKTFIAKESNTFEEEKNVAENAPVNEVTMDVLTKTETESKDKKKSEKDNNFILVISDFYYSDSANSLKNELIKKTKLNSISVKKINDTKYRLLAGPFKNFNALKTAYISLNNLGFEHLDIYRVNETY